MPQLNSTRMYRYAVEVGDRCDDGHGKWDKVFFETTLTKHQLSEGMKLAHESLEGNLRDLFSDYGDSNVPAALAAELVSHGWKPVGDVDEYKGEYGVCGAQGLVDFYMSVINLFTPVTWTHTSDFTPEISFPSSGYGLYH